MVVPLHLKINTSLQLSIDYINRTGAVIIPVDECEVNAEDHRIAKLWVNVVKYFKAFKTSLPEDEQEKILPEQKINFEVDFLLKSIENQMVLFTDNSSVYFRRKSKTAEDADRKDHKAISVDRPSVCFISNRGFQLVCMLYQNRAFVKPVKAIAKDMTRPTVARLFYVRKSNFCLRFNDQVTKLVPNKLFGTSIYEPQFFSIQAIEERKSNGEIKKHQLNHTKCGLCPLCPYEEFFGIGDSTYAQHLTYEHGVDLDSYLFPDPLPLYGSHKLDKCADVVLCPVCHDQIKITRHATKMGQFLSNYLRHFKIYHRTDIDKKKGGKAVLDTACYRKLSLQRVKLSTECTLIFQLD